MPLSSGVRVVATFEAAKGGLVLVVGFGLLALVHYDVQAIAEQWVGHFHLNPASRFPRIFLDAAAATTDARLWLFACAALGYAGVRLIEAYGLWHERRWAEWFAVVSSGLYMPIELYELWEGVTWVNLSLLMVNGAIVAYMSYALRHTNRRIGASSA